MPSYLESGALVLREEPGVCVGGDGVRLGKRVPGTEVTSCRGATELTGLCLLHLGLSPDRVAYMLGISSFRYRTDLTIFNSAGLWSDSS